jgi:hypothetical protein
LLPRLSQTQRWHRAHGETAPPPVETVDHAEGARLMAEREAAGCGAPCPCARPEAETEYSEA